MKDPFLVTFVEHPKNYRRTVRYIAKHHPVCSDLSKRQRKEFARNIVNLCIRKIIFGHGLSYGTEMCLAVRPDPDIEQVILSILP